MALKTSALKTTIDDTVEDMTEKQTTYLAPVHPGKILSMEFLKPLRNSQSRLAKEIGLPPQRIREIVRGTRPITADTAIRLGRFLGTEAQFWVNLQSRYELDCIKYAERTGAHGRFDFIKALMPKVAAL